MAKLKKLIPDRLTFWILQRASSIWSNMMTNNLWQRMLKNTLATTIALILAISPQVVSVYGKAAYLAPITTVFGHPGRRFGMMAEALVLAVTGTLIGTAWSIFGLYLSSLVYHNDRPAAYTIRALFLAVAMLFHGFLRSNTPRLFIMVLLLIIVSVVSLTSTAVSVSKTQVTQILYPILTAVGVILSVNVLVFPEFSSKYLGNTTIETLDQTIDTLRDAGRYFVQKTEPAVEKKLIETQKEEETKATDENTQAKTEANAEANANTKAHKQNAQKATTLFNLLHPSKWFKAGRKDKAKATDPLAPSAIEVKLTSLTDAKAKLRTKLASCKSLQQECNFELAFAVLPPRDLKPISVVDMQKLVANTVALIGACESKYALMGDQTTVNSPSSDDVSGKEDQGSSSDESDSSQRVGSGEEVSEYESDGRTESRRKRRKRKQEPLDRDRENLELVKPIKEIESGDVKLLEYLVERIAKPLQNLQDNIDKSTDAIKACLAYAYDVPKLPSGAKAPAGIRLEELDIRVDIMASGLVEFDQSSASALEGAVLLHELNGFTIDLMPRMETFLISSFLLNLRQAAKHTLEMLKHSRVLVEKRQERNGRRRLYAPKIKWRKWLTSGGEEDQLTLPPNARKDVRTGTENTKKDDDDEMLSAANKDVLMKTKDKEVGGKSKNHKHLSEVVPQQTIFTANADGSVESLASSGNGVENAKGPALNTLWFRNKLADLIEYVNGSEDVMYALKLTTAVFLVTWPAFIGRWNSWYSLNRGLWAALQLVLITEVAIGTSVMTFIIRGAGTTIGCIWGWMAFEASSGNRPACIVILVIGIIPSTYIQLGSKYVKAGMVSIVSMCIVALATIDHTVVGSGTENFLKRWLAFLIGGTVALLAEVVLYPVKARTRLVEALSSAIRQIEQMEACLAYGVETGKNAPPSSPTIRLRFEEATSKAKGSLTAAETFLPFCANEPRLKGSFAGLALVYGEILYVLHQIVEKMDNMLQLREEYGSSVLEELHGEVYPYRRNITGSITLILFAVQEALTTKLPLPQFMPSARLAHLRMINKVRSLLPSQQQPEQSEETVSAGLDRILAKRIVRQKFIAFQAHAAGQIEVIEYLEELQDLTKLLVGANEFRSGLLTRPTYREYVERINQNITPASPVLDPISKMGDATEKSGDGIGRTPTNISQAIQADDDEIRDVVPGAVAPTVAGGARRRSTFNFKKGGEGVVKKVKSRDREGGEGLNKVGGDELPRSLQRVRTRRAEERNAELERTRSRKEEEAARAGGRKGGKGEK